MATKRKGLVVAVAMMLVGRALYGAPPDAGSIISNQATVTYDDGTGIKTATSNTVQTTVAQVASFTLASSQSSTAAPGQTVNFPHTLTNTGNGTDTFDLSASDTFAGGFTFTNVTLYADANCDGVPDNPTPITGTGALARNGQFCFVAAAVVPGGAAAGTSDQMTVSAQGNAAAAALGGYTAAIAATNTDVVTVSNNANITTTKALSVTSGPSPNSNLTVTVTYTNTGAATATNVTLTDLIGSLATAGMSYVPGSGLWSGSGSALTDALAGDPAGIAYDFNITTPNTVRAVITSVPPGQSGTLSFRININAGLPPGSATTQNTAYLCYNNGVALVPAGCTGAPGNSQPTNTAQYLVLASSGSVDLTVTKTHAGNFTVGSTGTYRVSVSNIGAVPSSGPVTVTDTLPAGLTFAAAGSGGAGWSCNAAGQIVICTSSAVIPPASPHPNPLAIVVNPSAAALATSPVINSVEVKGGGEPLANSGNNSASDPTLIVAGARVSGRVWRDLNHNRSYDPGEPLLEGFIVELLDGSNNLLRSVTTNGNGAYSIEELAPGSGYRIRFRDAASGHPMRGAPVNGEQGTPVSSATVNNGMLEDLTLNAGDDIAEQSLPLDPSGVVYDAITRRAVAGAVVTLLGPAGFDPAVHLLGGMDNLTQTTATFGFYQYLLLAGAPAGTYALSVTPPAGYNAFPSTLIPAAPSARGCLEPNCLDPTGLAAPGQAYPIVTLGAPPPLGAPTTYYVRFRFNLATDPSIVNNHLPLDPIRFDSSGLLVQKTATRNIVEIGEFLDYTVRVRNASTLILPSLSLSDRLPAGFAYVRGSARFEGAPIPDPDGAGPLLQFSDLGTLLPNVTVTLSYRVRIGPGAQLGDGINRAQAASGTVRSNVASVQVKVVGGVFSDRGFILGKLYTDCNRNQVQDRGELGIPGVRLFLEDGTSAVSDSEGKFSFYGLKAFTHVLKVDGATLPNGSKLIALSNRNSGDPNSRFVDLSKGELHRADFAEGSCATGVMQEVKRRRAQEEVVVPETDRALDYELSPDGLPLPLSDPKSLPASGVVGKDAAQPVNPRRGAITSAGTKPPSTTSERRYEPLLIPDMLDSKNSNLPPSAAAAVPQVDLEQLLQGLNSELGFVDLKDGDTLPIAQTHVRVKGRAGSSFQLMVNGEEISPRSVGKKSTIPERQLSAWEYIGVRLKPGRNTLTLHEIDPFGNQRGTRTIHVIAPDRLGLISIQAPATAIADGHTPVVISVRLTDAKGVPITVRTPLTLETTSARWQVQDLDPREPGVQIFIEGGRASYRFLPPSVPIEDLIRVSSGILKADHRIAFLPELRPLIGAGLVEGVLRLRSFDLSKLVAPRKRDSFEEELENFSIEGDDGKIKGAARTALFLKGKVKGEYLLTLAYDSDKSSQERLFRDIQPDEFYPVYGDSSLRGFDAQSTSRLYVRVDKSRSYFLYGDYLTQEPSEVRSLAAYNRSLTGIKQRYEKDWLSVNLFAANDNTRQVIEEIPANGTSGPFLLKNGNILENSERVEILTRDRNQPAVILEVQPQALFSDYTLEPFTGRLLFKAPIASLDERLNRRSIRITYEVDQGGEEFWTYGMDAQFKLNERLELGGVYVRDDNPLGKYELKGANATFKLTQKTFLFGEYALSDSQGQAAFTPFLGMNPGPPSEDGDAWRLELRHRDERLDARAFYGQAGNGFNNPSAFLSSGRREGGAKATYALGPQDTLTGEALHTEDRFFGGKRQGAELSWGHAFENNVRTELGVRHSKESVAPAQPTSIGTTPNEVTSLRGKLSFPVPHFPSASLFGEYEQDLFDSDKRVAALGGDYQFATRGRVYARHELISSLSSPYALNQLQDTQTTVVGIDTEYLKDATLFTEYRARDAFDGRSTEAAIGTRNAWHLREGLTLNTSAERVETLKSAGEDFDGDSQAYTAALEYTGNPLWKASGRVEYYHASRTDSWLNALGLARKLNRDWTFLSRSILVLTEGEDAVGTSLQHRLQLGLAYRDTETNVWNVLARYEHKYEDGDPRVGFGLNATEAASDLHRTVDALSLHYSYQPERSWIVSGQVAAKYVTEDSLGVVSHYDTELLMARFTRDLTERWDLGLQGSVLAGGGFKSLHFGLGPEVGYRVTKNLWVSAGYNLFGFEDEDLSADEYTDQGVYFRLRFKFDEELFKPVMDLLD